MIQLQEPANKTSYSLDLSFDTDNEDAMMLSSKFTELDEIILKTVTENSKEWLGKSYDINVIREALSRLSPCSRAFFA